MFNASALAVVALAGLVLVACARHHNDPGRESALPQNGHVLLADQRFSPSGWPQALYADVYIPDGDQETWPAVLVVHGGGWERRSREDMARIARQLADRGFVAVNIDHRFAPAFQFPAQLHDVQLALDWMRDQAGQLQIDPDRIAGLGFSSGAHLVALAVLVAGTDAELNLDHGPPEQGFFAVVVGGTPSDFGLFSDGRLLRQLMGTTADEAPQAYRDASPIGHVHPAAPPFFLFHGSLDRLVPFEHSEVLYEALIEQGVHAELYRMRLRGHASAFITSGGALREATRFLHEMAGRAGDGE